MIKIIVAGEIGIIAVGVEGCGPVIGVSVVMIIVIVRVFGVVAYLCVLILRSGCTVAVCI